MAKVDITAVARARRLLRRISRFLPFPFFVGKSESLQMLVHNARVFYEAWPAMEGQIHDGLSDDELRTLKRRYRKGCVRDNAKTITARCTIFNVSVATAALFPATSIVVGAIALATTLDHPLLLTISLVSFAVGASGPYALVRLINRPTARLAVASGGIGTIVVVVASLVAQAGMNVFALLWSEPDGTREAMAKGLVYAGTSSILLSVMILSVFSSSILVYQAVLSHRYPTETAFLSVAQVGVLVFGAGQDLRDPDERSWGIDSLEQLARSLESGLVRRVRLPRPQERAVIQERLRGAATEVRKWQLVLALPTAKTVAQLRVDVLALIKCLLLADYDLLPGSTDPASANTKRLKLAGAKVRELVVAVLPVAILYIATRMDAPIDGALATGLWVFAVGWLVVCLIALIDPNYGSRLGTAREFLSLLKSADGGGK